MATRKSFDKERWEAMTGMEMSQLLPECENPESAGEVSNLSCTFRVFTLRKEL